MVECHIVPCDHIYWQVVPHMSPFCLRHQSFVQMFLKQEKAVGVVGANLTFLQERTIVGDCDAHGDVGSSLAWHSNCGPFANYVFFPPKPFREVEASFVNVDHVMWGLIGLQLYDSLKVIKHSVCKCFAVYLLYVLLYPSYSS